MSENRIEKNIELKASVSRVWSALTDHEEFGKWFGCKLEGPFVIGTTVRGKLNFPDFDHMDWAVDVKQIEPEQLFSFSWHPYPADSTIDYTKEPQTLVEFKLEAISGGTRLVVIESGFEKLPANRRLEAFRMDEEGWIEQLENIASHVQ
ncbi:MAG: SRPBCC family protein [Chloroflexota bacterium]